MYYCRIFKNKMNLLLAVFLGKSVVSCPAGLKRRMLIKARKSIRVENCRKHGKHAWGTITKGVRNQTTIVAHLDIEKQRHPWEYLSLTGSELASLLKNHHICKKSASLNQRGSLSNLKRQPHSLFGAVVFYYWAYLTKILWKYHLIIEVGSLNDQSGSLKCVVIIHNFFRLPCNL